MSAPLIEVTFDGDICRILYRILYEYMLVSFTPAESRWQLFPHLHRYLSNLKSNYAHANRKGRQEKEFQIAACPFLDASPKSLSLSPSFPTSLRYVLATITTATPSLP